MFKAGRKRMGFSKKDEIFEKIVEQFDVTDTFARQVVNNVNLEVIEKIIKCRNADEIEKEFVKCEQDIEKQINNLNNNKKFIEANDNLKILRSGHNKTVKPYKLANKLRLKALEEFV